MVSGQSNSSIHTSQPLQKRLGFYERHPNLRPAAILLKLVTAFDNFCCVRCQEQIEREEAEDQRQARINKHFNETKHDFLYRV